MIEHSRILVVGTPCTGKSTLAGKLAEHLHLPFYDLDEMHWLPGWKMRPAEELRALMVNKIIPLDAWIASGNYTTAGRDNIWEEAGTIVWLDLPLLTILSRYIKRTYRRIRYHIPCCNGNFETLGNAVFTREILLKYILRSHFKTLRPKYMDWMQGEMQDKQWIVCRTPKEVEKLLSCFPPPSRVVGNTKESVN